MRKALTLLLATALLGGCGIIYRQPVFQGNLLESKNVEQLQVGMTRGQVFSLLGSPPVADPFHQSRWDYTATERHDRLGNVEGRKWTFLQCLVGACRVDLNAESANPGKLNGCRFSVLIGKAEQSQPDCSRNQRTKNSGEHIPGASGCQLRGSR